ncbi:uncharacterized protein LOC111698191 [Eurytemora carolleeae]|uniref:uncharacterized protein LOC111698191 n=1 Tax=Eurytemora carolleeae TaxID=1294199 RepID=UPI000C770549|nr:uncharacterized protein LOC111698191 [Eurytemora carolleeae]|eukprot:XP_023324220.1 uncharacterized protein LOC111698191 [Eurytemora affinis]
MVDPIHVNQEPGDVKSGFNISVLTVRFDRIDEKMSGVYKCNLSLSLLEPGPGDIRVLRSRSGRLTVLSNSEQVVSGPDIELDISTGYRQGNQMHLMCSSQGSPAPYLVWSYIRGEEQDLKEETPVGRSKLETYPLSVSVSGVETRKLGLSVLCCSETKFSCSLQSGGEMLKTEVELVEHDKVWRLEMINPEVTPEDQKQEEEELEEDYDWRMNIFVWVGWGSAGICLLSIFICCLCCCICSHNKRRMTRKRRNQEILRREIYNNKKRESRSRSLSRRSTKRKAPDPSYSSQDPSFTSPDPDPSYPGYILEQQS